MEKMEFEEVKDGSLEKYFGKNSIKIKVIDIKNKKTVFKHKFTNKTQVTISNNYELVDVTKNRLNEF